MRIKTIKKLKGPTATFKIFKVKIQGKEYKKNLVEFPKTVGILPLISKNKIVLVSQYRFPVKKKIWEIPAGKLEEGEKPEIGAKRELKEETGYEAKELKKIGEFYLSPGYSTEYMYLFLAKGLKKGEQNLDKDEVIEKVRIFDLKEMLKMIKKREILDAKTILALFFSGLT
jgi:ADP-ribose pyrophosphatase